MKNFFVLLLSNRKIKNPKYHTFSKKKIVLFVICSKCGNADEKIFKEKESIEILEILGLIKNI